jgi:hypothetical protein
VVQKFLRIVRHDPEQVGTYNRFGGTVTTVKRLFSLVAAAAAFGLVPSAAYASASFSYLAMPDQRYVPINVVKATDGTLWLDTAARVRCHGDEICTKQAFGHVVNGTVTLYQFPGKHGYSSIAPGPGATLWILAGTSLYVYDSTAKNIAIYTLNSSTGQLSSPVLGADGRVWVTDFGSDLFAVTAGGAVSDYPCPNLCTFMTAGNDGKLWGDGLTSDYQPFMWSATTKGAVTEYMTSNGFPFAGPGKTIEAITGQYQISTVGKNGQLTPFADLTSLNIDQVYAPSASKTETWFVGTKNDVSVGVIGTIAKNGVVRSGGFSNVPCQEAFVYFSALVEGTDGAMYGGYGCGDTTGTHAAYLVRVAKK